ncbi:hypothetical protein [Paenarthrobacter sp. NPDC058040]|uniref:hypothetical protein n=1 Tax=unclassified Paenarthrobacter TaxID=2634190 RepID=UPI0036DC1847
MDFSVRPAVVDDAEGMAIMHVQAWRESYGHLLPPEFFAKQEAALQLCDPSWYSLPEHRMVRP